MLRLHEVTMRFGALNAVDGVSLTVAEGERRALIGPNGAGKSTLFATIAGSLRPTAGTIEFAGRDVTKLPEHRRARLGIARTFQHSSLFTGLTCEENVALAVRSRQGVGTRIWSSPAANLRTKQEAARFLDLMELRAGTLAGSLSHGEARRLEVAMSLARDPRLLLLDEPAAGMSAAESAKFAELIQVLDTTLLIVEHDLDVVFAVASHVTVLAAGQVIADGAPAEIRASEEVERVYLGTTKEIWC
ncbi:ABC transporter ATP-binding protein [Nonomuraea sp. NPDC050310]|uniref:ABC transporter ATP-binding protein n=1 Tax=Nonomuraea sp. NPDC050310 TaxID=3154935 RepID=UPI003411322C